MTTALRVEPLLPDCRPVGLKAQFACPDGFIGRVVGRLMGFKNWRLNRFGLDVADVQPDERALEIGFASGRALQEIARRAPDGFIAGVDISTEMVALASRTLQREIARGRVELKRGTASELPFASNQFTCVFSANSIHHWGSPEQGLCEIARVLEPGGRVVLPLRGKHPSAIRFVAPGYTEAGFERTRQLLENAGLTVSHEARTRIGYRVIHVVVAVKQRTEND